MKILDILKSKVPNVFKDKNPKAKAYKVKKSPYGVDAPSVDGAPAGAG